MEVDIVAETEEINEFEVDENVIIESTEVDSEVVALEKESVESAPKNSKKEVVRYRPLHLPLARIKQIIKMDPDVNLAASDAVFLIAKATELFIELLSKDSYTITVSSKKKTIQKKDVDAAIRNTDSLLFLDGAIDT